VFIRPGHGDELERSKMLQQYAKEHWYARIELSIAPNLAEGNERTEEDVAEMLSLLH
jgi:hypothetical protein